MILAAYLIFNAFSFMKYAAMIHIDYDFCVRGFFPSFSFHLDFFFWSPAPYSWYKFNYDFVGFYERNREKDTLKCATVILSTLMVFLGKRVWTMCARHLMNVYNVHPYYINQEEIVYFPMFFSSFYFFFFKWIQLFILFY